MTRMVAIAMRQTARGPLEGAESTMTTMVQQCLPSPGRTGSQCLFLKVTTFRPGTRPYAQRQSSVTARGFRVGMASPSVWMRCVSRLNAGAECMSRLSPHRWTKRTLSCEERSWTRRIGCCSWKGLASVSPAARGFLHVPNRERILSLGAKSGHSSCARLWSVGCPSGRVFTQGLRTDG